jgi:hypothetical protein
MAPTEAQLDEWERLRVAARQHMLANNLRQVDVLHQCPGLNQGNFSGWLAGKYHSPLTSRVIREWLPLDARPPAEPETGDAPEPPADPDPGGAKEAADTPEPPATDRARAVVDAVQAVAALMRGPESSIPVPLTRRDRAGYIYVMRGGVAGRLKVGRAYSPQERAQSLRTADPDIELVGCMQASDYVRAERLAHALLDHWRMRREGAGLEWFQCSVCEAMAAVLHACAIVNGLAME